MNLERKNALSPGLRRLQIFNAIARSGGVNAAAPKLRLSQPAISSALRALETDVGLQLLERGTRGSSLSEAGEMLFRRTTRLFAQIEDACATFSPSSHPDAARRIAGSVTGPQIRSLIALWRTGGVRSAASALGVSQVAVHRSVRALEEVAKTPLLRRTSRGIETTRAGAEFARRLSVAMQEATSGMEELEALAGRARSRLSVGSLVLAPMRPLAAASHAVLDERKGAGVEIREGSYEDLTRSLRSGALDMIFGALRDPPLFDDLATEGFFDDPYVLVCRKDHPLRARRRPTRAHLASYDWVIPAAGIPRRTVLEETIANWGLQSRNSIETTSLSAIITLLAHSDRLSLLSRVFMAAGGAEPLAALDLDVPQPPRIVGLTMRKDWLPTAFQRRFIDALRDASAPIADRRA